MGKLFSLILALVLVIGAFTAAAAKQPAKGASSPEKFSPLLGKWDLHDVNATLEVLSIADTGVMQIKYIGRSGREVPMAGTATILDGRLRFSAAGGTQNRIEYKDMEYFPGKGRGQLRGKLKIGGEERDIIFWPAK